MACSVPILLSRMLLAGALCGSALSGCEFGRRTVLVGDSVEMRVPEAWKASPVSGEDDLGTNLWLFHAGYGAAVRVIVVPSTKLTPAAVAAILLPELYRYRYCFDAAGLPAEDTGQDVVLECGDQPEGDAGLLLVRRLRSGRGLILVFVGVWPARAAEPAGQELSDIAGSARPARK